MKKLVLVDGNNLMFRSYYATAYTGNVMKNSKGVPTNALFGFVSMINKIIAEEKPEYLAVAFDIGTNFRKQEYSFYKEGRSETPKELIEQFPIAKKILEAMGIKYLEKEPYEADDIIGTLAKLSEEDSEFESLIVSSDKDLLQLISSETSVKLLKQTGFIMYNEEEFLKDYGIEPIKMIDLKALMGDQSDNIPGVKGIGEKTALKLLQEYSSLEGVYENIDNIKGKTKEKLVNDKEMALISKKIATIYRSVPLNITLEDLTYEGARSNLKEIFQELEFFSFLKSIDQKPKIEKLDVKIVNNIDDIILDDEVAIYLELDDTNYHTANILGLTIKDSNGIYYIDEQNVLDVLKRIKNKKIITYDAKKIIVSTKTFINCIFDLSISAYLLNYMVKDDIAYLMSQFDEPVIFFEQIKKKKIEKDELIQNMARKVDFIYNKKEEFENLMINNNCLNLFNDIEMPLIEVLASMEIEGIKVEKNILDEMKKEIDVKLELIKKDIYNLAGIEFNIGSPKQLGEVLFEKLQIDKGKKNKTGYKTDAKVLEKLIDKHPIIEKILTYRNLSKIYSTYIEGLENYILDDSKIHTIFKQTLTRTGRLSSTEPNLQNIPIREELGRSIRKAFVPVNDLFLSADYSQIELRILAHISNCKPLIESFKNNEDIHTKVASDIYGIDMDQVTKKMRRTAKAVIFGIVYGISGFGLGENLHISNKEAAEFINKYYELYPEVKSYMDNIVEFAKENGYVKTLFNRKRIIDEINNPNYMIRSMGERMALNSPIQGTSADIMKLAMINVYKEFKRKKIQSKILLQVHDEIIIDVKSDELESVKTIVKEQMEQVYKLSVPLHVEIDTGTNWYEAK